jgi:hypothetical protein
MSSHSPTPPPSSPDSHSALINAKLVVVETVTANKRNKKASTKKTVKNKQFMHQFDASNENYVDLMNNFLKTHHKDKYHATVNHTFVFKIQVPPAKYERQHHLYPVVCRLTDTVSELGKPATSKTMKNTRRSLQTSLRQNLTSRSASLLSLRRFRNIAK